MKTYLIHLFSTLFLILFCQTYMAGQLTQKGNNLLGSQANESFGSSTAMSQDGKVIAVGGYLFDGINGHRTGRVQIYQWQNNSWIQKGVSIEGVAANDLFGSAVSMSNDGNIVAIGASENDASGNNAGQVRIYEWNGTSWIQKGMALNGETAYDESGGSVSLSANGNIIAIGAQYNMNSSFAGHTRIYEWNGTAWIQKGTDIDGEAAGDYSGRSVSMSANGNIVAIGAPANSANGFSSGQVRIYEWNGIAWIQKGMDIDGTAVDDFAGRSVSLSANGNTVAIGSPASNANGIGIETGRVSIYEWNGTTWVQKGINIDEKQANSTFGSSVDISDDGNTIITGAPSSGGNGIGYHAGYAKIFEWNGTAWVQNKKAINGRSRLDLAGSSVGISGDASTIIVGAIHNSENYIRAGEARVFALPKINGFTYLDLNQNCQQDTLEMAGIASRTLILDPSNLIIQTNTNGYWSLDSLPIGNYTINTDTNSANNYQPCAATYSFSVTNSDSIIQVPSIGYQSTRQCTAPDISIQAPFLRPGFSNQRVYVQACNTADATAILDSAYVVVELDSLLTVDTASLNYTSLGNNQYYFYVDSLYPNQCVNFWISTTLNLNATLGQSLCMNAKLYPVDSCALDSIPNTVMGIPCSTPFDGSHLTIYSTCNNNDTISFTITNTEGDMSCWSQARLYVDGTLVRLDSVQLLSGQSQVFSYAGDGRTWRMEVDQHPLHYGNSQPSSTIELCGNANNWTSNLVNILPMDDADPVIDIFCGLVTGSYDPNDKTGFPLGKGTDKEILPNQKLEYVIRFQNTGTDTAFTVVIRDTLSTDFDIFSVVSSVSSHDYSFRMYGPRVLEWTFNNIMLPDSNVNEPLSNGFVQFEVNQNEDLPNGTLLENSAAIFFDFNAPIITNTSVHTINDRIPQPTRTITASGCDSIIINGYQYNQSGVYYQPVSQNGIDSLYILNLSIGNTTPRIEMIIVCDSAIINGQLYTQSSSYTDTFSSTQGCDSIVMYDIMVSNTSTTQSTLTACDSITLNGKTYTQSGIYMDTLASLQGCDSILVYDITISNSYTNQITLSICDSTTLNGKTYTQSGIYADTLATVNGCDSILLYNITKYTTSATQRGLTACDSIVLNGQTYTRSGVYTNTLLSMDGCDSIVTYYLTINSINKTITQNAGNLIASQTASGSISYQWIDCNNANAAILGATNRTFTPAGNGDYAVEINNGTCTQISSCFNYVLSSVSNTAMEDALQIKLYPNPTTGMLQLDKQDNKLVQWQVTDQLGRVLQASQTSQQLSTIDLTTLPTGLYFITINNGREAVTQKIVKQ